jgi:hypothetical protein
MRIDTIEKMFRFLIILFLLSMVRQSFAQPQDSAQMAQYEEEMRQMVAFLQYSMNVLGDPTYSAKEKDVVINESYGKVFAGSHVQIEDDLDENREVVTNKDVQAYLKDVDFFFRQVVFTFTITGFESDVTADGTRFFTVTMMRNLTGVTVEGDSINSDQERYIEINLDEAEKDLKIASIYTTKLSRNDELTIWWAGLSPEWKEVLGSDISVREGLQLSDIRQFSDSTYLIESEEVTDSLRIINFVIKAANKRTIDLSGNYMIQDLKPLNQLKQLERLDLSGSAIKDLFPIRNITTLTHLNCSNTLVEDLSPLRYSKSLSELSISNTSVQEIDVLENFAGLEALNLSHTVIDSIPASLLLAQLKELHCGSTNITSLEAASSFTALRVLDCSNTMIDDLQPLSTLRHLVHLNVGHTMVESLQPLKDFPSLKKLSIEGTIIDELSALENMDSLLVVYADGSGIGLDAYTHFMQSNEQTELLFMSDSLESYWESLDEHWKHYFYTIPAFDTIPDGRSLHKILIIRHIDVSGKQTIADLKPLRYTPLLESLDFSDTPIANLAPLQNLNHLKKINGAGSQVMDLRAITSLARVRVLNFERTGVASLDGFSAFEELDTLIFNKTNIKHLSSLNGISFKVAYFDDSRVVDEDVAGLNFDEEESVVVYKSEKLRAWWGNMPDKWQDAFREAFELSARPTSEELHRLSAARSLQVSGMGLRELDPISEFVRLESLSFTETRISALGPVSSLRHLKSLKCPRNPIDDLEPLRSIQTLQRLDVNNTKIRHLKPVSSLENLKELTFSGTNVKDLAPVAALQKLEVLDFSKTKVRQIKALESLQNLKTLTCYNNKISEKRIQEFRLKNPECEVIFY